MRNARTARRFGQLPLEFFWALGRGELTFMEFAVGAFLVCAVDFQTREAAFTVRALADALGWPHKEEQLRRVLAGLKTKGWIDYDVNPGQRRPYLLRLRRLDLHNDPTQQTLHRASRVGEVTSTVDDDEWSSNNQGESDELGF